MGKQMNLHLIAFIIISFIAVLVIVGIIPVIIESWIDLYNKYWKK